MNKSKKGFHSTQITIWLESNKIKKTHIKLYLSGLKIIVANPDCKKYEENQIWKYNLFGRG